VGASDPSRAAEHADESDPVDDIVLAPGDVDALKAEMARVYRTERAAVRVLSSIGYPRSRIPAFGDEAIVTDRGQPEAAAAFWDLIFYSFDHGIVQAPYRRLLDSALRTYAANPTFNRLAAFEGPQTPSRTPTASGCHVVVRDEGGGGDGQAVIAFLDARGLKPRTVWATTHDVGYLVASADVLRVRSALADADFSWVVLSPGQSWYEWAAESGGVGRRPVAPDSGHVLQAVTVEGPDGRKFRMVDVPVQMTVGEVAAQVVDQYRAFRNQDLDRPTVVDDVASSGRGRRLDPEATLHDAGVQDGDRLRVGYEAKAGGGSWLPLIDAGTGGSLLLASPRRALGASPGWAPATRGLGRRIVDAFAGLWLTSIPRRAEHEQIAAAWDRVEGRMASIYASLGPPPGFPDGTDGHLTGDVDGE
jgi:hypothetical protein